MNNTIQIDLSSCIYTIKHRYNSKDLNNIHKSFKKSQGF